MKKIKNLSIIWLSLVFFILMLLDAHLTIWLGVWDRGNNIWQSELLLLTMFFASYRYPKSYMISISVVIGALFDLYYMGLLGIYAVAIPLLVWSMYLFHKYYYQNLLNLFFSWVICLSLFQFFVLGIQAIFKLNVFLLEPFIVHSFGPTLLINIFAFFVWLFPLKRIFKVDIPIFTSYKN